MVVLLSVFFYGLVLGTPSPLYGMGAGGAERRGSYPLRIWVPSMGGYVLGEEVNVG